MAIRLTRSRLDVGAAYRSLQDRRAGGIAIFAGTVRPDRGRSGTVTALFYEAHRSMAKPQLELLEQLAKRRFGARRVVLWHRLGTLPVGEIAVIVGVSAPHRAEALTACRTLIDRLKSEVPIWKSDRVRPARRRRRRPGPRDGR